MAPHLYKNLAYDPVKDFTPIGRIDSASFVLVVSAGLPVQSVAELVTYAKSKPGLLNYASSGNGTTAHLSGTLFNHKAAVDIVAGTYAGSVDVAKAAVAKGFALVSVGYAAKLMIKAAGDVLGQVFPGRG